jgi:hypothetical protein
MGIAYTLKQFYNRQVYIVAGMYETAFDQKYICNATFSVILPYPQQYIKIAELDCYQITIKMYMYHLYTLKHMLYIYP